VRLGREVHDEVRAADERGHRRTVADVRSDEGVPRVVHHVVQVLEPARVRQLVERGHLPVVVCGQRVADEVAADEPRAARDEHFDHRAPSC